MLQRLYARWLWLANSSRPVVGREEFYALKRRLLERYGHSNGGEDVQEITKECYGCDGTGKHPASHDVLKRCWRCSGSGVYTRFWVRLMRWEWCGYPFHLPGPRLGVKPESPVTIRGYVRHGDHGRKGNEALLWLLLRFDRRQFRRQMTGHAWCGWTWWPLTNLQRLTMRLRLYADRWRKRACGRCGRQFRRPFQGGCWFVCRRCERWAEENPILDDMDEIPF